MHTADERAAAIKARDDLLLEAIRDGLSVKAIAARIGVEEDYAKRERRRLAAEHGLNAGEGSTPEMPFGLTRATAALRMKLGTILVRLTDRKRLHPVEIAFHTGVTQKAQTKASSKDAKGNVYNAYDWKLSELERLASLTGKDFKTLMKELLDL